MLLGHLDRADDAEIVGWAFDTDAPGAPVDLELMHNGRRLAQLRADQGRQDLLAAGIADGRCGFRLVISGGGWSAFERHEIAVRRAADGAELPGSPVMLEPISRLDGRAQATIDGLLDDQAEQGSADMAAMLAEATWRALLAAGPAQAEAARRFQARWADLLPQAPGMAEARPPERPPAVSPRVLMITPVRPDARPLHARWLGRIGSFRRLGHEVLVAAHEVGPADEAAAALAAEGVDCAATPFDPSIEDVLRRNTGLFDVVCIEGDVGFMQYGALARRYCPRATLIYGAGSLRSVTLAHQAVLEGRPELAAEAERARIGETVACLGADLVLVDFDIDKTKLREVAPNGRFRVARWGVAAVTLRGASRAGIGFVGDWSDAADRDAGAMFIEAVLPALLARHPAMPVLVAGAVPEPLLRRVPPGVVLLPEAFDVLARVRLTVMPRRLDAGLPLAVVASLAAGVPVVGGERSFYGLEPPVELARLLAEQPDELARIACRLHDDHSALTVSGAACAALMRRLFEASANDTSLGAALGRQILKRSAA